MAQPRRHSFTIVGVDVEEAKTVGGMEISKKSQVRLADHRMKAGVKNIFQDVSFMSDEKYLASCPTRLTFL
jgi:hypothetical protein